VSHDNLDSLISSIPQSKSLLLKFKSLSELMSTTPEYGTSAPPPGGSSSSPIALSSDSSPMALSSGGSSPIALSPGGSSPIALSPGGSSPIALSSEESYSSSSWEPTESHPDSTSTSYTSSSASPSGSSTQSDDTPPPGPSTERNPPPSAKRPRPEESEHEPGSSLRKIFKGKFKRRFSGPGAWNAAQGDLHFNSRAYVSATSPPPLFVNRRT
jgi:hypothetical protein